jgi:hypothetical protein
MGLVISKGLTLRKDFLWNETVWNPSMISTALWLDAADASTVTESSGLISQVNDKSGNGRNFTASGAERPTYSANTLNSKAVFTFTGTQFLTSANAASTWNFLHNSTGSSIFAVFKAGNVSAPNAAYLLLGTSGGTTSNIGLNMFYDDRSVFNRQNTAGVLISRGVPGSIVANNVFPNNTVLANTSTILSHRGDPGNGTASLRSIGNVNGGANIGNNTSTDALTTSNATFTLQIGASGNGASGLPFVGYISEVVVAAGVASTDTRQRIEGYLAHKWALTANLPSDHPYKTVEPTP